ncbi:hypothetical protein CSC82_06245 [Rhodobacteraceae bacterium 4F10]|nr:hypothetical protein CSC82_06245 [Rhodobacteraceae bacterium 4F10]
MIGLFLAAVQIVVLENGLWQAFTTYMGFAIGYPIAFFLFLWLLDVLRHRLSPADDQEHADAHHPVTTH